jgi:hypothetical protein
VVGNNLVISVLREITGKAAPGQPPAYTPAHVLMGLELIGARLGVGRQQLSRELRLGEGTIRTMVGRFKSLELVSTSRGGMGLTDKGREILTEFGRMLSVSELPETPLTVGSKNYAVLVKGASAKVSLGIEQRDAAMIVGAKGATTLVSDGKGLRMPSMEDALEAPLEELILRELKPMAGDVIIIGSSDDCFLAELGAKSAALGLIEG